MEPPELLLAGYAVRHSVGRPAWLGPLVADPLLTICSHLGDPDGSLAPVDGWRELFESREESGARAAEVEGSRVLAVGMERAMAEEFLTDHPVAESVLPTLWARRPMPATTVLGYEIVLGGPRIADCSWDCFGTAEPGGGEYFAAGAARDLGVTLTEFGLIPTYLDAQRLFRWFLNQESRPDGYASIVALADPWETAVTRGLTTDRE